MVLNVGRLKDQDYHYVHKDIHRVVSAAGKHGSDKVVKVANAQLKLPLALNTD